MKTKIKESSLLDYYRSNRLNPVPISLRNSKEWRLHFAKRRNLYERHLGIPISCFKGRSVLEFGCASGENALVLAALGANLTLVEPNEIVLPRLRNLFRRFGLLKRIVSLKQDTIESFTSREPYDFVLAEGFITSLAEPEKMLKKICSLAAPGGLVVISFDDLYGHFLEMLRKLIFWRAARLRGVGDMRSQLSLKLARELFEQDFARLNASRPFRAWWEDVLLNPFVDYRYFWTISDVLPLFQQAGFEFYSSSPKWAFNDHFTWYKNCVATHVRRRQVVEEWKSAFSFFLTGVPPMDLTAGGVTLRVTRAVSAFIKKASLYISSAEQRWNDRGHYPGEIDRYLGHSSDPRLRTLNDEIKKLLRMMKSSNAVELIDGYHMTNYLRRLWGMTSIYVCFVKGS